MLAFVNPLDFTSVALAYLVRTIFVVFAVT